MWIRTSQLWELTPASSSCKYHGHVVPSAHLTVCGDGAFTRKDIFEMEERLMKVMKFNLSPVLCSEFLNLSAQVNGFETNTMNVAKYLVRVAQMKRSILQRYKPHQIVHGCIIISCAFTGENISNMKFVGKPLCQHHWKLLFDEILSAKKIAETMEDSSFYSEELQAEQQKGVFGKKSSS
ncbi:G2/mitotic-specific cyclin-B-like [Ptychodera flava]|uniref:G2/mitotic-specific cyclin-B-like n=1 Tax=Ptychodera flava TaxID=63121 RepID=UPI003969D2B3